MTDARNQLVQEALQIGSHHKHREVDAQKRQNALRLEMQQQEAIADAAGLAFERGLSFGKTLRAELLCPQCWVANGRKVELIAQPSDTDDDLFICRCGYDFVLHP